MTYRLDRCHISWCRRALHLDDADSCPAGHVLVCEGCDWREACPECDPDKPEENAA